MAAAPAREILSRLPIHFASFLWLNGDEMPPQQPQQPGQNNYDFFMNPEPAPKRKMFGGGGGGGNNSDQKQLLTKIILGIVALIIILVGFTVVARVAGSGNRQQTKKLIGIAQRQQEIARLAQHANNRLRNQPNRDFNASLRLTIGTDQHQLLSFLKSPAPK
jgi:flagellar basal body-associated protein FliL